MPGSYEYRLDVLAPRERDHGDVRAFRTSYGQMESLADRHRIRRPMASSAQPGLAGSTIRAGVSVAANRRS
ncbi:MAG: hypothetical protein ACRDOA_11395 [Streptosporangiaceae bacterium]